MIELKIKSEAGWSQLCPGINFEQYFFFHFAMLVTTKIIVNGNYPVDQP